MIGNLILNVVFFFEMIARLKRCYGR